MIVFTDEDIYWIMELTKTNKIIWKWDIELQGYYCHIDSLLPAKMLLIYPAEPTKKYVPMEHKYKIVFQNEIVMYYFKSELVDELYDLIYEHERDILQKEYIKWITRLKDDNPQLKGIVAEKLH